MNSLAFAWLDFRSFASSNTASSTAHHEIHAWGQRQPENYIPKVMKLVKILAGVVLASSMLLQVHAADTKVDPSGTYVWTQPGRNGGADRTNTLTLKLDGEKLTGKVQSPARGGGDPVSTDSKDGKINGSEISFAVSREFNGNSFTIKYSGKLADGVIKGKTEFDRGGETQSREWEAKKQEDKK
jgi:hypothetical protein